MNRNIPLFIDELIYDPVKGRILYDVILSFGSTTIVYLIFYFFQGSNSNYFIPAIYALLLASFNSILGLYGRFKTSNFQKKLIILTISNTVTYLLLLLLSRNYLLLTLFFAISTLTTILPRFFLNFNVERITLNRKRIKDEQPILVVGGGGYIGSVLVEQLLKKGEKVRVLDKFVYSKSIFKGMKNIKNLDVMEGDISDIYSLTLAVKDTKAIVHLAGIVGDPAARLDENLTRHVNIASTRLLKETAKAFGVEKFVFASSCSVYGTTKGLQTEKSKPKPISLYAKSKIDSEIELLSDRADNFHPVILRFATVFGHSKKPRFDLVANLFVAEAFNKKSIQVYGGAQWRPFVHVKDVARAIVKVLDAPNEIISRQIFNVGDDSMNIKISDLANIVKDVLGNPKLKIKIIGRKKDQRDYRVSFRKINKVLDFKSSITIKNGIREIYKNFLNKRYKKNYNDPYYINFEITKELQKEFKSSKYRKSHFSTIS